MPKLLRACASRLFHRSFTGMKITDYMVDRTIHLGPVFEVAEKICQKRLKLDAESNEAINFIIFYPGCIMGEAFDIIETMQMIKSPVHTICLGEAAASLVLCAGSPGMRMTFPNSRVMIHEPRISLMYTHPARTLIAANQLKSMEEKFIQYYARFTGLSRSKIKSFFIKDSYLSAQEALDNSIIDTIINGSHKKN